MHKQTSFLHSHPLSSFQAFDLLNPVPAPQQAKPPPPTHHAGPTAPPPPPPMLPPMQAFDLLNPVPAPQQAMHLGMQPGKGMATGMGGALRMRWNKAEDFYLENLFKVGGAAHSCVDFPSFSPSQGGWVQAGCMWAWGGGGAAARGHQLQFLGTPCTCGLWGQAASAAATAVVVEGLSRAVPWAGALGCMRQRTWLWLRPAAAASAHQEAELDVREHPSGYPPTHVRART